MTTALAIYGAAAATCGLLWQVFTWRRANATRVTVELNNAFLLHVGEWHVVLRVTNRSSHAVRVTGVGFELQDRSGRTLPIVSHAAGASIPGEIRPHDSGEAFELQTALEHAGLNLTRPLVGFADLSTNERVRSEPTTLHE